MKFPFLRRETESERLAKFVAKEEAVQARRIAWKSFWFRVQLWTLGLLTAFVALIVYALWITKDTPRIFVEHSVTPPSSAPSAPHAAVPSKSKPAKSQKPSKEGIMEKLYEKATGKEVVHKKDGTTYERRAN